jgi:hypothetical protein
MERITNYILAVVMLMSSGCTDAPLPFTSTPDKGLERLLVEVESDLDAGRAVDWQRADEHFEAYCASLATASYNSMSEIEREHVDRLVGRYWAARVKTMSLQEVEQLLSRKARQFESFLDNVQR